jgi:hypothetical protein
MKGVICMFFRCRARSHFLKFLLMLLGIRLLAQRRLSESEREEYRGKAKTFRRKLRDAFAVWDDEEQEQNTSQGENA